MDDGRNLSRVGGRCIRAQPSNTRLAPPDLCPRGGPIPHAAGVSRRSRAGAAASSGAALENRRIQHLEIQLRPGRNGCLGSRFRIQTSSCSRTSLAKGNSSSTACVPSIPTLCGATQSGVRPCCFRSSGRCRKVDWRGATPRTGRGCRQHGRHSPTPGANSLSWGCTCRARGRLGTSGDFSACSYQRRRRWTDGE